MSEAAPAISNAADSARAALAVIWYMLRRKFLFAVATWAVFLTADLRGWTLEKPMLLSAAGLFVVPEFLADLARAIKGSGEVTYSPPTFVTGGTVYVPPNVEQMNEQID